MAQRRMFTLAVIDTDRFNDMPVSARLLYYELGMRADDDGFVASPKKIVKMIGCTDDDLKLLIAKNFVICFDSGVIVIKDWKLHNYIPSDRYHKTMYQDEFQQLTLENNVYSLPCVSDSDTTCIQPVYKMDTEDRIGKDRLNNNVGQAPTAYSDEIKTIIEYLNQTAATSFRTNTKATRKHISARLKEGYSVKDFKKVIDSKVREWSGTDMKKYLRPETLFGSKFEGYLNASAPNTKDEFDLLMEGYNR